MSNEIRVRSERRLEPPPLPEFLPRVGEPLDLGAGPSLKKAKAAIAKRAEEQAALYEFTDKLFRAGSLDDIYDAAFDAIGRAFRCYHVSILLFDKTGVMRFVAWRGLSAGYRKAVEGHTPWKPEDKDPQPVCVENIDDADVAQALKDAVKAEGIRALAFIPLIAQGGVVGKFMIYYERPHAFGKDELDLAVAIARQIGFGVERVRAQEARDIAEARLEAELADTRLLQSISAELIEQDRAEDIYEKVLDAAMQIMRAEKASMQVLDENHDALRLFAFRGFDADFGEVFKWVHPDTRTACSVARRLGRRVVVPDVEACDFIAGTTSLAAHQKAGVRAVQSTPLVTRTGKLVGMISTHWRNPHEPSDRDLRMMDILARQATDLIESKQAQTAMQQYASIVESSDDAIITKDLNGIITSWNKGAERLFGYMSEEIIGKSITILIPSHLRSEETTIIERIRRGQRVEHYETIRQRKHGSHIDISLTISPIKNAHGKIIGASKIARDITQRKRADAQILMLAREAEHRAKNVLANVQATVHLSQADTPEELKRSIEGRLRALANVHGLFVESRWTGADLHTLIAQELSAYRQEDEQRALGEGPTVWLEADTAQTVAIAVHELTTNAAKYGALSVPEGRIKIEWSISTDGHIVFHWAETGGPPVQPPTRQGFGTRLMETVLREHKITFDWRPGGLNCEIKIRR